MIKIVEYTSLDQQEWDTFVSNSPVSNFQHSRRFLSYHGSRFNDKSLLIRSAKGKLIAVFSAAEAIGDSQIVVSHPGATFGGLVASEKFGGDLCLKTLKMIAEYYQKNGYKELIYKPVPHIYHISPAQDDLYALFRLGASRVQSDLSATIDLKNRKAIGSRRRRGFKKAISFGVQIKAGKEYIEPIWKLIVDNLQRKHQASPVHSLDEIKCLQQKFPEEIDFIAAELNGELVSGVVLFYSKNVAHAQYIASSKKGYQVSGLDVVFEYCIDQSRCSSMRYFDFGTSNENNGCLLNSGLYEFKSEFGAGGVIYDRYKLLLDNIKCS